MRPRTSKGITAFPAGTSWRRLNLYSSIDPICSHFQCAMLPKNTTHPTCGWPVGPPTSSPVSWRISTYLKPCASAAPPPGGACEHRIDTFARVAAAERYFGSPQDRHTTFVAKRSLNQVVLLVPPAWKRVTGCSLPDSRRTSAKGIKSLN